jgi:hypothetical protein
MPHAEAGHPSWEAAFSSAALRCIAVLTDKEVLRDISDEQTVMPCPMPGQPVAISMQIEWADLNNRLDLAWEPANDKRVESFDAVEIDSNVR